MNPEISDIDWIKEFNKFSREFYYQRYMATSKLKSTISSIILPSDRREIKIGINILTKKIKNKTKSIEDMREQVLDLIEMVEDPIKHHYEIMQQQIIEKAIQYDDYNIDDDDISGSSSNIAVQLINYILVLCDGGFSYQDATKIIEQNQQKYKDDFIERLLGSIVPILVEKIEEGEFNEDIKNIAEDFIIHDLDVMVIDVATEKQRRNWSI
jgi:hypothetical protein